MADQQFCLRWNDHQSTLISVFDNFLENGTLVDCTLAAEGEYLKAHRVVLSASSPYLESLLSQHYEKHPIVILNDVKSSELKYIMDYMYRGEVNIPQDHLKSFLKAAESLRIKGLSANCKNIEACNVGTMQRVTVTNSVRLVGHSVQASESPASSSRDGSLSPVSKIRRKNIRISQDVNISSGDTHLDTSNSYDFPSEEQSPLIGPNIPENITSSITSSSSSNRNIIMKPEQIEMVNQTINVNASPLESRLIKENTEPCKPLLEPKTEYLDDDNSEDNVVEDLTLDDDDDEINRTDISNLYRPHQSYGISGSSTYNQAFLPWKFGINQSAPDEVNMATQGHQSAHNGLQSCSSDGNVFKCGSCGKSYQHKGNLNRHQRYECGDKRPFACLHCPFAAKQKNSLQLHVYHHHM